MPELTAVFEKVPEGYIGFVEELPGANAQGATLDEARANLAEAVQLVLIAAASGNGGELFVLDMGEPVKIVDLAKNLITLSGLKPDEDIELVYTGLRPGEKLFEELSLDIEGVRKTSHEKIRVLYGGDVSNDLVQGWLSELATLVDSKNLFGLVTKLKEIVPEYSPSNEIVKLCEFDRYDKRVSYNRARSDLLAKRANPLN